MKTMRIKVDLNNAQRWPKGRINLAKVDATTEDDIKRQQKEDDADVMKDAAPLARPKPCSSF
jgi:putative transcriptional regulator